MATRVFVQSKKVKILNVWNFSRDHAPKGPRSAVLKREGEFAICKKRSVFWLRLCRLPIHWTKIRFRRMIGRFFSWFFKQKIGEVAHMGLPLFFKSTVPGDAVKNWHQRSKIRNLKLPSSISIGSSR